MAEMRDITAVILNWKAARMTRGAVASLQRWHPGLRDIIVGDDGSGDSHGDFNRAYAREAYAAKERLDMNTDTLKDLPGTRYIGFEDHMGHGLTLDRIVKYVKTPLMLTMDNDIRITGPGLLEEYLAHYNEDPNDIFAIGTKLSNNFMGKERNAPVSWKFTFVSPGFSLWNMEPLRRYERLSFTNFIAHGNHFGTAAFLNWQLQHNEMHRPRGPYKPVFYPRPEKIARLWHLRKFPSDLPDSERTKKWGELMDG